MNICSPFFMIFSFLGFAYPITITVNNTTINNVKGTSTYFFANVSDAAMAQLTWRFEDKNLIIVQYFQSNSSVHYSKEYNGRAELQQDNCSLQLKSTDFSDAGTYVITAEDNNNGTVLNDTKAINLRIYSLLNKPSIIVTPDPVKVGDDVTLNCTYNTGSNLRVSWYRNNSNVTCGGRLACNVNSSELHITLAETGDSGLYMCSLENPVSVNSSDPHELHVYTLLKKPSIIVTPDPVKVGDNVTLNCTYNTGSNPRVSWYRNNSNVTCGGRLACNVNSSELHITLAETGDSGLYMCSLENPVSVNSSDPHELHVYIPVSKPVLTINPAFPKEEDNVTMECTIAEGSDPVFLWYKNNQPMTCTGRYECNTRTNVLSIYFITPRDSGEYSCAANNSVNSEKSEIVPLTVYYGPYKAVLNTTAKQCSKPWQCVEEGTFVNITCDAESFPPSNHSWYFNGSGPTSFNRYLEIYNVSSTNNGNYTCQAHNDFTARLSNVSVFIVIYAAPSKPTISSTPTKEGDDVTLNCTHTEEEEEDLTFVWLKDSKTVNCSSGEKYHCNKSSSLLIIDSVDKNDSGDYMCILTNLVSSNASDSFPLQVWYLPRINLASSVTASIGEDIFIDLDVSAVPEAHIFWTNNLGEPIKSNTTKYVIYGNGSLLIKDLTGKEAGVYLCLATNDVGSIAKGTMMNFNKDTPLPSRVNASAGENIVLNCTVSHPLPSANITWFNNNNIKVNNSTKYELGSDGTLLIIQAEEMDSGFYMCITVSAVGFETRGVMVSVKPVPKGGMTATEIGLTCTSVILGVILIVVVSTGVFLYRKSQSGQASSRRSMNGANVSTMFPIQKIGRAQTFYADPSGSQAKHVKESQAVGSPLPEPDDHIYVALQTDISKESNYDSLGDRNAYANYFL